VLGVRLELLAEPQSAVAPGAELRLEATVRNVGTLVESLAVRVQAPVGWITVEPGTVAVYPGTQESVSVLVAPPLAPSAPAGTVPFRLVAQSTLHPRVTATVDSTVFVGAIDQLSAEVQPATATGRWRATARLVLRNGGNRPVQAAVVVDQQEQSLQTTVRPALVEVGPGQDAEAAVSLRPRRRLWFGQPVRHPYRLRIQPRPGTEIGVDAAMVQVPLLPRWLPRVALVLVPIVVAAGVLAALRGTGDAHPPGTGPTGGTNTVAAPTTGPSTPAPSTPGAPHPAPTGGPPPVPPPPGRGPTVGRVTVPGLRGLAVGDALDWLGRIGLRSQRTNEVSNEVAVGAVIRTDPAPGIMLDRGAPVRVVVSAGPTPQYPLLPVTSGANWRSGAGALPFPGSDTDNRGFALLRAPAILHDGTWAPQALEMHPEWVTDGFIEGDFRLPAPIRRGDHFLARLGLLQGAGGEVRFEVLGVGEDGKATPLEPTVEITPSDPARDLDVDLSPAAGAPVLRLRVVALNQDAAQDWALWAAPRVEGRLVAGG